MRLLLFLPSLLFVTAVAANEPDFDFSSVGAKKGLREYRKALVKNKKAIELKQKKLDEEADNLANATRDAFVEILKKALRKTMQAGNLEEANKIDAAIKALDKGSSQAGDAAEDSKEKKNTKKSKARIPRNSVKWNGHHYMLFDNRGPHSRAEKICQAMGGHLVRIQSPEEQQLIKQIAKSAKKEMSKRANTEKFPSYWIDGTDEEKEGVWIFSDGTPMKNFYWHPGYYDNDKSKNHIEFYGHEGTWNDNPGTTDYIDGFICEWDE